MVKRRFGGSGWAAQRIRISILIRDNYICHYCGGEATEADHVLGIAAGGSDDPSNLVASCRPCNQKRARWQQGDARREAEAHPGLVRA